MQQKTNGLCFTIETTAPSYSVASLPLGMLLIQSVGDPTVSAVPAVINAPPGSLYLRGDGGAGTTLYVREPAGWVGK